jgi:hypothetical protein
MNYEQFNKIITEYRKLITDISELGSMGFDFYEGKYKLISPIENILFTTLELFYTNEGIDWISWFMYESDFGDRNWKTISNDDSHDGYGAHDENGNPICHTMVSLFDYIEKYKIK